MDRKELLPNMKVKNYNWDIVKKKISEKYKNLTCLWNITYQDQQLLFDKNIISWSNPLLNIDKTSIKSNKTKIY